MSKILVVLVVFSIYLTAFEIKIDRVKYHTFKDRFDTNAKIVQLSSAKESIGSIVGGHIEQYYVKPAQIVKKNQKVALINSMEIAKISAEYISYKKQFLSVKKNFDATKELYKNGMVSLSELNNQTVIFNEILAKLNSFKSQLELLGIKTQNLKKATSKFILYAHSSGRVSKILKPLHSAIEKNEELIELVKDEYYLQTYLPLKYASLVNIGDTIVIRLNNHSIKTSIEMIMPNVDEITQRFMVLSKIDIDYRLFTNSFVEATLYISKTKEYLAVKKSAISFFNNEWVVFTPKEHSKQEHNEQLHNHNEDEEHHHEDELPYGIKVIKILTQDEQFVAISGLEVNDEYISSDSYYIKSQLLKSSLGGHGH